MLPEAVENKRGRESLAQRAKSVRLRSSVSLAPRDYLNLDLRLSSGRSLFDQPENRVFQHPGNHAATYGPPAPSGSPGYVFLEPAGLFG